jgi:hypothetical protein
VVPIKHEVVNTEDFSAIISSPNTAHYQSKKEILLPSGGENHQRTKPAHCLQLKSSSKETHPRKRENSFKMEWN